MPARSMATGPEAFELPRHAAPDHRRVAESGVDRDNGFVPTNRQTRRKVTACCSAIATSK